MLQWDIRCVVKFHNWVYVPYSLGEDFKPKHPFWIIRGCFRCSRIEAKAYGTIWKRFTKGICEFNDHMDEFGQFDTYDSCYNFIEQYKKLG